MGIKIIEIRWIKKKWTYCKFIEKWGTGIKKIKPNIILSNENINKAKHNLLAMDYNIKGNFNDWAISQAYYAMYHGF